MLQTFSLRFNELQLRSANPCDRIATTKACVMDTVWSEELVSKLKSGSTTTWEGGKEAFTAMPNAVAHVISKHSAGIDSKLLRSHYKAAKSHLDQLVQQNDSHAQTLSLASAQLSELLKHM